MCTFRVSRNFRCVGCSTVTWEQGDCENDTLWAKGALDVMRLLRTQWTSASFAQPWCERFPFSSKQQGYCDHEWWSLAEMAGFYLWKPPSTAAIWWLSHLHEKNSSHMGIRFPKVSQNASLKKCFTSAPSEPALQHRLWILGNLCLKHPRPWWKNLEHRRVVTNLRILIRYVYSYNYILVSAARWEDDANKAAVQPRLAELLCNQRELSWFLSFLVYTKCSQCQV